MIPLKNPLELINKFSKVTGYKVNIQKLLLTMFLYVIHLGIHYTFGYTLYIYTLYISIHEK